LPPASVIVQRRPSDVQHPDWRAYASCRGLDPSLFFHGRLDQMRQAQRVCARCPVAEICLWTALLLEDPLYRHGVFGGLLPGQRHQLAELCDRRQAVELLESELAWFASTRRVAAS
jgi:WhiB family transcriptional regulator, redox-sensing transcriptional regulator